MTELKFYLLYFMIAASLCSVALSSSGAPFSPFTQDEMSINLPPDSDYEEVRTLTQVISLNLESEDYVFGGDFDWCLSIVKSRGAHAFYYRSGYCPMYTLRFPLCRKWEGNELYYVRKDFLTDGSPNDNATTLNLEDYQGDDAGGVVRYFRIDSPKIFEFGVLRENSVPRSQMFKYFAVLLRNFEFVYSERNILADPSCYTTSSCGHIFLTTAPEIPASELLILHDICSQSFELDSGKFFYVLSHEGLGCKYFPNNYPVKKCWTEFTGPGELNITVNFVSHSVSDQCDGFTLTAVTDDANGSSASTDLCDATAPTKLTSASEKVRIVFHKHGRSKKMYGFNIQISAA